MDKNNAECNHEGYPVKEEHLGQIRPASNDTVNQLKTSKITSLDSEDDLGSILDNLHEMHDYEMAVGKCSNCGTKLYERPEEGTPEFYEWQKNGTKAAIKWRNGEPIHMDETFKGIPDFHTWATKLTNYHESRKLSKQFDKIVKGIN